MEEVAWVSGSYRPLAKGAFLNTLRELKTLIKEILRINVYVLDDTIKVIDRYGNESVIDIATDAANELNKYLDIVKLPVVETPVSETTLSMDANKVYDITIGESLTLTLNAPTDLTVTNEYQGSFDTGSTAPTVTFPADVIWAETPSVEANTHYEFNIRYTGGKYYGLVQGWNINTLEGNV